MNDAFEALTTRFRARCGDDLDRLRDLAAGSGSGEEAHRIVHALAGAAGVFGFQQLSEAAASIDEGLTRGEIPSASALARLDDLLGAVARR